MTARVLGIVRRIEGCPPEPPYLLVSNHLSYVDIAVLASCVEGRFVAKEDVASWPLLGPAVRASGAIFVNRTRHRDLVRVGELMGEALKRGEGVVFFPEGTSSNGASVLPFHSSMFEYPAREGHPVHYASVSYRAGPQDPPPESAVCWWGDMDFFDHFLRFLEIPRITASIVFGAKPIRAGDRKVLAKKLHDSVQNAFTPVVRKEVPCSTKKE